MCDVRTHDLSVNHDFLSSIGNSIISMDKNDKNNFYEMWNKEKLNFERDRNLRGIIKSSFLRQRFDHNFEYISS